MKIPQDVKKLRRYFEKRRPQSGKKKATMWILQTNRHTRGRQELASVWKKCMKGQKFNHFSFVCKSKGLHNSKKGNEQKRDHKPPEISKHKRRVKRTTEEDGDNSTSSDDEFFCQAVRHLKQVKKIKTDGEDRTLSGKIEDADVRAEPDNATEVNVMDERQIKALTNRSNMKLTTKQSKARHLAE